MIVPLLIAATVSVAPATAGDDAADLLRNASHAIESARLEQASIMVARAMTARAAGPQLARVLANLAFAKGNYGEALVRYQSLVAKAPDDVFLLERAAISALELGDGARASPFIDRATALQGATWRAWNARGVAADMRADWADADLSYRSAARLGPNRAEPLANQGWSMILRGRWQDAVPYLEQAAALDRTSTRIADNLELAKAALAGDLPERRSHESLTSWAQRLNDAGVAAAILGNKPKASAAFTQALEASGSWYAAAANNLDLVKQP